MMKPFLKEDSSVLMAKTVLAIAFVCVLAACGNNKSFDSTAWHKAMYKAD